MSRRKRGYYEAMRFKVEAVNGFNGCCLCPEKDPCCLDFHHRDEEQKRFTISLKWGNGTGWEKIAREMKRCVVLCANCHRKDHAGKMVVPPDTRCVVEQTLGYLGLKLPEV